MRQQVEESLRRSAVDVETAAHGRRRARQGDPEKDAVDIGGDVGVDRADEEFVAVEQAAGAGQGAEGGDGKVFDDEV